MMSASGVRDSRAEGVSGELRYDVCKWAGVNERRLCAAPLQTLHERGLSP